MNLNLFNLILRNHILVLDQLIIGYICFKSFTEDYFDNFLEIFMIKTFYGYSKIFSIIYIYKYRISHTHVSKCSCDYIIINCLSNIVNNNFRKEFDQHNIIT